MLPQRWYASTPSNYRKQSSYFIFGVLLFTIISFFVYHTLVLLYHFVFHRHLTMSYVQSLQNVGVAITFSYDFAKLIRIFIKFEPMFLRSIMHDQVIVVWLKIHFHCSNGYRVCNFSLVAIRWHFNRIELNISAVSKQFRMNIHIYLEPQCLLHSAWHLRLVMYSMALSTNRLILLCICAVLTVFINCWVI